MNEAAAGDPRLEGIRVRFEWAHFAKLTAERLRPGRHDFIVLSPQGTPWSLYEKEKSAELRNAKTLLEEAIKVDLIVISKPRERSDPSSSLPRD